MVGGKQVVTKEYRLWCNMLNRCYGEKYQQKCPTYSGCLVSENFKYFQYFAKWCQSQIGFGLAMYQLDKDILTRGNKVYSETTCVFVPRRINNLLIKSDTIRGEHPIGVSYDSRDHVYRAYCKDGSYNMKHLGFFDCAESAFNVYKVYKEALIRRVATDHKSSIDPRVFDALMSYEVSISD